MMILAHPCGPFTHRRQADHEWDGTGRCRLCGEGLMQAGVVCLGGAAEPEDAEAALQRALAAIGEPR